MTAHVFIVDEQTFPLHLRYQFAGTGGKTAGVGSKDLTRIDFNACGHSNLKPQKEIALAGMIADVSRIRSKDRVIFYLQQKGGKEGCFYGIFRAIGEAFLDNGDKEQFLLSELGKSLTFRVLIEPETVYAKGVTEWHALDEIERLEAPYHMLWSLIYRKLKGNRGCTMITPYEEKMLCELIRKESEENPLLHKGKCLDFDQDSRQIVLHEDPQQSFPYTGSKEKFALLPRIMGKASRGLSFEAHLQAHIAKTLGTPGDPLTKTLLGDVTPDWLGNEVSCGVGMQRIDLMLAYAENGNGMHHVMPIELKSVQASADNIRQIQRYVDWTRQYYIPNHNGVISPVLLTKANPKYGAADSLKGHVHQFNHDNANSIVKPLRRVEFSLADDDIHFKEVN